MSIEDDSSAKKKKKKKKKRKKENPSDDEDDYLKRIETLMTAIANVDKRQKANR